MKPFNLEEAVELHKPVVTRDGRDVWLAGYNPTANLSQRLIGWVDGSSVYWYEDGRYAREAEDDRDLFMKSQEGYVGFYTFKDEDGNIEVRTTKVENTEREADEELKSIVKASFWYDIQNIKVIKIYV
jgi:hypothetical protein